MCVCVNSICATTSSKVTDWTKWVKTNTKKRKKRKGELFCLPICLSICARRRVKSSNLDFTWLGGLRSAVGWRMFVSSGSRRAVWSLKSVRSSIKKNSSLWCFGGQCSQTAAVCGWVTTSYNTAGTCYCLYSCRCSVWYTLNLNCSCWMCSGGEICSLLKFTCFSSYTFYSKSRFQQLSQLFKGALRKLGQ